MNKKVLYAIIAVVVVIILIVAVFEIIVVVPKPAASMTVSVSSSTATAGQTLTFAAFISGGTPSKVIFNFGDGVIGSATHLLSNEYTVTHSYSSAGRYLVTANATVNGKFINNLKSIDEVTVSPATVSPTVASEITVPTIITSMQIVSPGSTVSLTASTLQPPTATNWTIGYYLWNFGDGSMHTNYTMFNTSSGAFMSGGISHLYSTVGIYAVTLGVITFNATNYVPTTFTSNGINYTYYPLSDLKSILSSGNCYNNTYISTIVVNSNAQLLTSTVPVKNPNEIISTEVVPGGPYSLDPTIDYDIVGMEVIANVYETLIQYNGSSTTPLFPMVASEIPTLANGGISANYLNYTFQIRSGLKFANGDPLTAWDAYTSCVRDLLFAIDTPSTAGWILAQDLLPGGGFAANATSYQNITQAMTVNNATQTMTFHLLKPDPAFLDYLADPQGAAIMDYNWLAEHGAGITFSSSGFATYQQYGNEANYNTYIEYNMMGSGPYMIKSYLVGQSVILAPNPYYTPIPYVLSYDHAVNDTIYIQWIKDPGTALLIAKSGETDIICGLPNYDYPIMAQLQSQGKINITSFPILTVYFFNFNFNINESLLQPLGVDYSVPQYYFTNLDVRRAFAYAFNYINYIENLVGNAKYGADFAFHYTGIIPEGMPGYMNATQLQQAGANVPVYNLTIAKQYMEESGLYNTSINIPIIILASDATDFAAVEDWATTLNSIDPNIHASALYMEHSEILGYLVPDQNPMPIYLFDWTPDYPYPSDYVISMYQENGTYGYANGWNPELLSSVGQPNQSATDSLMNQYIAEAENTGNATLSISLYDKAEVLGVNLTLYTYTDQANGFWFYSSALHGVQNEENPMYAGSADTIYIYLSK
jgi:ABC-type transport system substrate-binding protein